METNPVDPIQPSFPERMFAFGEEPLGIRVTPYHKPSCISKILNALDEEEISFIKESSFGKLIEIADKPSFSGRVGRFLFSRLLKTRKLHEVWFLFAGKPIRFSIKEFALVTGLNCRKYPPSCKKKSKKILSEKPYWGDLFGSMTEVPVSYVVTMLKKKMVTDTDTRIKYALLALLSAVILPTSHNPRILHVFAEKIRDVDQFLAYPWGRTAFDMLMSSIKERNEVSLSQNTIAFKGFVMAVQLVLIEAVPSLLGVVRDGGSSGSEEESHEEEEICVDDGEGKKSINTTRFRDIDSACKVQVNSIISDGVEIENMDPDDTGYDDEHDVLVDNLVKAVEEGFLFSNSHFKGGATKADVNRMREEGKKENQNRKTGNANPKQSASDGVDVEYVVNILKMSIADDVGKIGQEIKDLASSVSNSQNLFQKNMLAMLSNFQEEIIAIINTPPNPPNVQTQPSNIGREKIPRNVASSLDASDIIDNAMRFANKETSENPNNKVPDSLNSEDVEPHPGLVGMEAEDAHVIYNVPIEETVQHAFVNSVNRPEKTTVHIPNNVETSLAPTPSNAGQVVTGLSFPDPSFSIGLTQLNKSDANPLDHGVQPTEDEDTLPEVDDDAPLANRKSKRARVVPRNLVGDYHCDQSFLTRAWESYLNAICSTPTVDYSAKFAVLAEKMKASFVIDFGSLTLESMELSSIANRSTHLSPKILDVLIHHTRSVFLSKSEHIQSKQSVFLDTKFVTLLAKSFTKFSKASRKENVKFPAALCSFVTADCPIAESTRYYFPFNFDKQHWVGVCVDCSTSQLVVLDCNTSIKTDAMIAKDLRPVTAMFPYILRQAGKQLAAKDLKPLAIDRPRSVPQNTNLLDSGITSTLLIQAHAVGGVDVCKCITPIVLDAEAQRITVMIYEENIGDL